jgi:hypothetical protein
MNKLIYIANLLSIVLLFVACQSEEIAPVERETITEYGFAFGELPEPEQSQFTAFDIPFGKVDGDFGYVFWQGNALQGELGPTLIIGAYPTNLWSTRPLIGFQFWSDDPAGILTWTDEGMETFFAPGTTFEFGEGPGKVDLMLRLPIGGPYAPEVSKPSHLAAPQGQLTVQEIRDYDYPVLGRNSERIYGKWIRCTFSGQIGRYDSLADQMDGDPNFFQTDEVVELMNGEVEFFVRYAEE